ncbi:DegV family protein [Actinoallomurus iriomotensis]|uniref:DegV domain-containing protein n=1 Tax=Actinoallomurus iriomotensis TaxID=478107 RepID=A0A9W6S7P3_9ACTN|nr:DegV family protein [Actinoallomurus iriomotensis]GLY90056.1 DegV domain-containing protein [Actinoallomurus iriomotensis]
MRAAVAIVTDSTAYLPEDVVSAHDVTVVPLQVAVGGDVREEGRGRTTAGGPRDWRALTTSRPSPERFGRAYEAAAGAGARAVASVHLSGEMSGTVDSARLAADDAPIPVRVVDSRSIGMGLGFGVMAAAEAAASGAGLDEVAEAAMRRVRATRSLFYVDTLEHLRRGGRIGAAASLLGSALMIKPLLRITGGRIAPLEKVRTTSRALARLEELAVELAGDREVDVAVQHVAASSRAAALAARLRERIPRLFELYVGEAGPVVGAHVGPGMLGVVVSRRHF